MRIRGDEPLLIQLQQEQLEERQRREDHAVPRLNFDDSETETEPVVKQ